MGKFSSFFGLFICRSSNSRKKAQGSMNSATNENSMTRPESAVGLQTANNPSSNASIRSLNVESNPINIPQSFQSPRNNTFLRINTVHQKENIEVANFRPEQKTAKKRMKYTCPICFRYFNEMLKADCCGNYICIYCAQDLNECIKSQKIEKVVCHFCKKENFTVSDVKPEDKLRRYTDSPYSSVSNTFSSSFKNNNRPKLLDSIQNPNKQYSSTFSGFGGVRTDDAALELPDERVEAIKSASCGFNELKKISHEYKHSHYSERMDENVQDDDIDADRKPRKLFSALDVSNVVNRPRSQSFEFDRNILDENNNQPPKRMISVIFEKDNEDITLSEIPSTRARPNNRQRSPVRMTGGSIISIGRLEDRSVIPHSHNSESILSLQTGLRG